MLRSAKSCQVLPVGSGAPWPGCSQNISSSKSSGRAQLDGSRLGRDEVVQNVFDLFVHHYIILFNIIYSPILLYIVHICSLSGSSIFDGGLFTKSMEVALFMGGVWNCLRLKQIQYLKLCHCCGASDLCPSMLWGCGEFGAGAADGYFCFVWFM